MLFDEHEENVSRFYSRIKDANHDYNGGFLTFGIWKRKSGEPIPQPLAYKSMYDELIGDNVISDSDNVLEVACGQGSGMLHLKSRYGCNVEGVDISKGNLECAKRRLRDTNMNVSRGSATRLPFKENSFDVIVCVEAAPHFKPRVQFFKEAYRVLKPGGRLFISDCVIVRPYQELSYINQLLTRVIAYLWLAPLENYQYGIEEYKEKLENSGFKISRFDPVADRVYPGYCNHNLTLSVMRQQVNVRGYFVAFFGGPLIDMLLKLGYNTKCLEYVLVVAEKAK